MAAALTLIKWEARAARRRFWSLLRTGRGMIGILFAALAAPVLYQIAQVNPFASSGLSILAVEGAATLAHLAFVGSAVALVASTGARVFVLTRVPEPLAAMPWSARSLALHRVVARVLLPGILASCALFVVFAGRILLGASARPLPFAVAYVPAIVLLLTGAAPAAFLVARRAWQSGAAGRGNRGGLVHYAAFALWLVGFGIMTGVGEWTAGSPALLEAIGRAGRLTASVGQLPMAFALAAASGRVVAAALSFGALCVCAAAGIVALRRWADRSGVELVGEPAAPGCDRRYASVFAPGLAPSVRARTFRLFVRKDVWAACRRDPARYAVEQSSLTGTALVALAATAWTAAPGARAWPPGLQPMLLALGCAVALAAFRGLGCLGSEGRNVRALRTILTSGSLFRAKAATVAGVVALHAACYGWLLVGAGAMFDGRADTLNGWRWLAAGLLTGCAGGAFAILASAFGFLLPAFSNAAALLPGASRAALVLYLTLALPVCLLIAALSTLDDAAIVVVTSLQLIVLAGLVLVSLGVRTWAIARLEQLEL